MIKPLLEARTGRKVPDEVMLADCPERVLPCDIFREIVNNDRLIGGIDERSSRAAAKLYASFVKGELYLTDDVTAEFANPQAIPVRRQAGIRSAA